jgi:hypothetical protein
VASFGVGIIENLTYTMRNLVHYKVDYESDYDDKH